MAYDKGNIFAKILKGEIPAIKVYEDASTFAFLDIMPQARGHTLVIPKAPAENLFDLPTEFAGPFLLATQKVARAVKAAVKAPGLMIAQLNGAAAGQSVFHVHFHIIPRTEGIDLALHARAKADPLELEAVATLIRAEIN
ncbi:MAG: HIT family protein [Alphaproteobacteria bacterium]